CLRIGNVDEALDCAERAITPLKALLERRTRQAAPAWLGAAYRDKGVALSLQQKHAEAVEEYNRALALLGARQGTEGKVMRGRSYVVLGRHAAAAEDVRAATADRTTPGHNLALGGRALAQAVLAAGRDTALTDEERRRLVDGYAAEAVALLERARQAGYFRSA